MASPNHAEPLKPPSVMDMQAATELHDQIKAAFARDAGVVIDGSEVEVLTSPCIQVLLAAGGAGSVQVFSPSDEFLGAFRDLALAEPERADELPIINTQQQAVEEAMPKGPQRILTIDDSKTMRDMLRMTLVGAGYEVLQGVDGQDGIEVLGEQMVDAVITDINMPRMDGYGVIRALREMPRLDDTPILVLTTESEKDKRNLAKEAGATGWMVKPFDPEKLIATLRKVLPVDVPATEMAQ